MLKLLLKFICAACILKADLSIEDQEIILKLTYKLIDTGFDFLADLWQKRIKQKGS